MMISGRYRFMDWLFSPVTFSGLSLLFSHKFRQFAIEAWPDAGRVIVRHPGVRRAASQHRAAEYNYPQEHPRSRI